MNILIKRINIRCFNHFKFKKRYCTQKINISGVYPPIITPFDENEEIAYNHLENNIEKWNKVPFRGLVIQGSNGEFASLSEDERVDVVKFVKQHISKDKLLIAGSGCEGTRTTVKMTERMAAVGADIAMVVTPCYYKGSMNEKALIKHYITVADKSPIPIILYSVPPNTSLDLSASVIIKLSSHPNIIGLKDSGGDVSKLGYIVHKTKEHNFQVLAGSAGFFLPALTIGCVGGIFALANPLGEPLCNLHKLFLEGKLQEAQSLQLRLISPNIYVTKKYGVAGLKAAMEWFGYYGGSTRLPILPISKEEEEEILKEFKENKFL
ncbi:4-hydroxy-2-oxoglutarate aldolase, mitochondrial-like [Centruroides sculpturatus]|uniref:4-hydroxy-2-oxoglutarate aldolase, mitochondrial-like n=1 Tax=Centruroides sculpturatus TaxID=218467 RepID=UPI000C6D57F3|nr:4-hydroxy-2-oxoglutarate aldolase, mitochondrial-like [Centruroides sculpturatus]